MRALMLARGLIAVIAVLAAAGCSVSETPQNSDDNSSWQRLGWTEADVPVPGEARDLGRIGEVGPKRLPTSGTVMVNFWASSCAPCREEMPWLQRLSAAGEVDVVGVNRDFRLSDAREETERTRVTFPQYSDALGDFSWSLQRVLPPAAVPTTILVSDGRVRWVHIGPFKSYADLRESVSELLACPVRRAGRDAGVASCSSP